MVSKSFLNILLPILNKSDLKKKIKITLDIIFCCF